jgi:hypothetical protein
MARQPKSVVDAARQNQSKASLDPSTPSLAYRAMAGDWKQISDVLGGTKSMRAAGKVYLPQHEGEGDTRYKDRLQSSTLTNYTLLTLEYWVGKPFKKPAVLSKDTDADILALADDIDLSGNELTVVLKDWFSKGMAKQVAYCLVEFPEVPAELQGRVTLADQQRLNLRPYWCIIPAEAMIDFRKERINGEDVVTHCRFYDNESYYDGFEEKVRVRIREINRVVGPPGPNGEPGEVSVVQRLWTKKDRNQWDRGPDKAISLSSIPCVEFNTGKMELLDLTYLNITHYQSASDQRNCLTTARFPILAAKGVATDTVVTIGPYAFLAAKDANSEFYYVEHTGAALDAGQTDLDGLTEDMALYGAEALKQRPDRETATSRVLDQAEATAPLQVHVFNFISCVNTALYYTALWMEKPEGTIARVEIDTDFAMSKEASQKIDTAKELRKSGDISRKQFLAMLVEAKALPESFNAEANEKELVEEAAAKADQAALAAKKLAQANPKPSGEPGGPPKKD